MGPKKKEKKKKKKKEEKPPKPTKSQYVARIADQNAILAKARQELKAVEDAYFDTDKRYEQLQEDMADILEYLQHEIEENEKEIEKFNEKIGGLQKEIDIQDKYYSEVFSKMESEFEEKQKYLESQIQIAQTKLFASAEIKKKREEYLRKKEAILKKIEELKEKHKQEIYEAEKEAIIKQDKMQREMVSQLTSLANDFRQATDTAIGETTNKLIRESIDLGNKLTCMEQSIDNARNSYLKVHALETKYRFNAELLDEEQSIIQHKYASQNERIEALIKSIEDLNKKVSNSEKLFKENKRLQRQIAEKECILKDKTEELEDQMKILEENNETFDSVKGVMETLTLNMFKIESVLFEAAKKVKEALDIQKLTRLGQEDENLNVDKEELEENLKEYKFKIREKRIEEIIEKLGGGLMSDTEMQLIAPSSQSYLTSQSESVMSEVSTQRSKEYSANLK